MSTRSVGTVLAGVAAVALAARVSVPVPGSPVPQSLQTLAVVLVGAWLGPARGATALVAYLLAGTLGLPVFADGTAGIAYTIGPTAGYLAGFVAATGFVGWWVRQRWGKTVASVWAGMAIAHGVILAAGWLRLTWALGAPTAFAAGVAPFLLGGLVKSGVGALLWVALGPRRGVLPPPAGRTLPVTTTAALVAVAVLTSTTAGQEVASRSGPTVGLALSGGSAKGFAHVGVLRVLERAGARVDVLSGTSMGAVIGALYAIGTPADSIEMLISSADWPTVLGDGASRERRFLHQRRFDERAVAVLPIEGGIVSLPAGAIVGSNIVRFLEQATWRAATVRTFADLPRPFAAVATDIESGEPVTMTRGVLSEVLRASTGIPGAFEPFELGGRLLVDGAVSRNLPASDARDLGADFVICSDVSDRLDSAEELRSLVDVLDQVVNLAMRRATAEQRTYCDVLVQPDVEGISALAFDRLPEWVERGETAAEVHKAAFEAVSAEQGPVAPIVVPRTFLGDSVRIARIDVEGSPRPQTDSLVRKELRVVDGAYISPALLASRLSDIDATGLFGLVRYRRTPSRGASRLPSTSKSAPRTAWALASGTTMKGGPRCSSRRLSTTWSATARSRAST